jgi:hypothetical protein
VQRGLSAEVVPGDSVGARQHGLAGVGGVDALVEGVGRTAAAVIAASGAGVGVPSGVLPVLEGDAGLAGEGDEGVPQAVGAEMSGSGGAGVGGDAADQPPVLGSVESPAGAGGEQRPRVAAIE